LFFVGPGGLLWGVGNLKTVSFSAKLPFFSIFLMETFTNVSLFFSCRVSIRSVGNGKFHIYETSISFFF